MGGDEFGCANNDYLAQENTCLDEGGNFSTWDENCSMEFEFRWTFVGI